jgi:UPF0716 protein FxsA
MLGKLFVSFTVVTLAELFLLIEIGNHIGALWTILIVLGTGFLGASLVRNEGRRVLQRIKRDLERLKVPADPMLDGMLILISGAFLLTPGILTDLAGFLLLLPPVRVPIKSWAKRRFKTWIDEGRVKLAMSQGPTVQDGEWEETDTDGRDDP